MPRGHYGIDAPGLVRGFLTLGLAFAFASFAVHHWNGSTKWCPWIVGVLAVMASYALFMFAYMLWGSLVAKVRGRDDILSLIPWTGHEQILDVGCGRGLLLIGAARRLTTGKAIGVDLWIQKDQSSNQPRATLENARLEKVLDRVQVETGDMRQLPFLDSSFDVVVSSWAVHNLELKQDRDRALAEMVRVLKPGGSVLLNDIVNREEYEEQFNHLGLTDVRVVTASKWSDVFSSAVSFGSFRPATVLGRKRS
jgi:ubiquinone/menaquinone biosynthesis C-methylase UbiE